MEAAKRRKRIASLLLAAGGPIPAATLASRLGVSRQVIVGDVALLRASGAEIMATPRGYVSRRENGGLYRTVACVHDLSGTEAELLIMVDNGCGVLDVVVEHPVYGQLTGELRLMNRYDVGQFMQKLRGEGASPLSALTGGVHLHTLLCPDEETFERTVEALDASGFLLKD